MELTERFTGDWRQIAKDLTRDKALLTNKLNAIEQLIIKSGTAGKCATCTWIGQCSGCTGGCEEYEIDERNNAM